MTFFVHHVQTYMNVNNKGKEMCEYVQGFERMIITDDASLDAMKCEIEEKVKALNEKYPRMKPLTYGADFFDGSSGQVTVRVENDYYKPVCFLSYKKVRGTYSFSERVTLGQKTIEDKEYIQGICRICGCTDNDPCFNPKVGNCWWVDDTETLCSHCANSEISVDLNTKHCINTKGDKI